MRNRSLNRIVMPRQLISRVIATDLCLPCGNHFGVIVLAGQFTHRGLEKFGDHVPGLISTATLDHVEGEKSGDIDDGKTSEHSTNDSTDTDFLGKAIRFSR